MLKILRNKKIAKKIWIGLAVIIIPAFALWGFGGASRDRQEATIAGKIFGKNITNLEFRSSLVAVRTMAIMQFGDKLPEIEKYLNFQGQAWERLILLHEAKMRRINVKDKEVIEEIQNAPYFQVKNGFSNKIYQEALRYVLRLQARIFEEQTRQNLILAKLYNQITQNLNLSDDQIHQEYLKANEELNIYYIASLFLEFAKTIKPSEKEISSYFEQNKARFKEPPTKDKPTRIPELAEIKDKVRDTLINETAKEIAQKKINECAEKLKQMEFNQAAAFCGLKSAETDFFKSNGTIENLGTARIFWDSAKKLKDKELSSIISNDQGCYIIKLKSLKPIDENKFLKEKESFSQRLLSARKNELFAEFIDQLKKKAQ
ncbi:MAG: SurA N-terminal domain-containing protein [Candidatus Omnitrophota bacterium]|nr:SurA N-terminal domain-containing protein [Candidatus Omnitrophota bacterium]